MTAQVQRWITYLTNPSALFEAREASWIASASADEISQLLEKLVQQGYVTRSEDPLDRRNKILEVTDGGRKIATEAILERQKWISQVVYILSEEEKQQVEDTLQLLINKVIQLNENEH